MEKEIYFCIDNESYYSFKVLPACKSMFYSGTKQRIEKGVDVIITTSLAHLTFDVINRGYTAYLCYKDKQVKIEVGMELHDGYYLSEPSCCEDAEILDCFACGYFNEMLGIKDGEL